jgi:predicted NAD/FAD-binding protein
MVMSRLNIAVVGAGIAGLGAAWLLRRRHDVTLIEAEDRLGGHAHTIEVDGAEGLCPMDTGFIVYNTQSYPNLIALFDHLGVATAPTHMSFSVSLDAGRYEYSGTGVHGLFGQPRNLLDPDHWRMVRDILRFFREAGTVHAAGREDIALGDWLAARRYSSAFVSRHILPMAAAIWSTPAADILRFPAAAFARFFANHGLLQVRGRPQWRTVPGGSRSYVTRIAGALGEHRIERGNGVRRVLRRPDRVEVLLADGSRRTFDQAVLACHADQALALIDAPSAEEASLLSAFRYQSNLAVLHRDAAHMPRRRRLWSSWNYLGRSGSGSDALSVSYWMNRLQPLATAADHFVTLNPSSPVDPATLVTAISYRHPMFDAAAMRAQRRLWQIQGVRRTWYAGSYHGYGFHEDGLQAGLWVAETLGGVARPWRVAEEGVRIHLPPSGAAARGIPRREAAE